MATQKYIHSGYFNIYRPPYSLTNSNCRSSIYCVSDRFNSVLIMIPLVPSFYKDAIELAKSHPARKIYLIASDIGVAFASDYYLTWSTIEKTYRKSCKIFSKYMIENFVRSDFKSSILRTENDNISIDIPRSDIDVGTADITLSKEFVSAAAPFACDIILKDTYKKILFVCEMNEHKAKFLNDHKDKYDEIHMPFMTGNYGGYTYNQLIKKYPGLVNKVYCNQFASYEEYEYAKSRYVKVGGAFKYDSL